mgnify:CR=1 FL=1
MAWRQINGVKLMLQGDEYSTQVSFGHVGREDARRITFINANMEHLSCAKSQEHEHIDELNTMAEKTHASNKRRSTHARKTSIIMSCQNRIVLSRQYICTYTHIWKEMNNILITNFDNPPLWLCYDYFTFC